MNKKIIWASIIILVALAIGVYAYSQNKTIPPASGISESAANEKAVRKTVIDFGTTLDKVSLLAPAADVKVAMDQQYAKFVAPELLVTWKNKPSDAPGRLTSSPTPDRIEIVTVEPQTNGSYTVRGNVIETTSTGDTGAYPVALQLEKRGGVWLITSFQGYPAVQTAS